MYLLSIFFFILFSLIYKGKFMQQNVSPYVCQPCQQAPTSAPNAVSINIFQPQAYATDASAKSNNCCAGNYYPLYQANQNPSLPLYPMNYNNMIQYPNGSAPYAMPQGQMIPSQPYMTNPYAAPYYPVSQIQPNQQQQDGNNSMNAYGETNLLEKTSQKEAPKTSDKSEKSEDKKEKPKTITLLTNDYVKSLENYLNDDNPKVRLMGAKELMERFKEDDSRVAHPSLVPLLNKTLKDTSPSVRFLGLTTLQLGYSVGDEETIKILKNIQQNSQDKLGEDALLASEILLKLTAPKVKEVK